MALKLPEHSHCLHCGDPTPYGTVYCNEECEAKYKKERLISNLKEVGFYITVGLALCILAYRFIF